MRSRPGPDPSPSTEPATDEREGPRMHLATAVRPRPAPTSAPAAPPTVMVTGAGGRLGALLVQQLRDRGMRVIRTDITPADPSGADFVLGPYAGSPSYVPFLEATLARLEVDLLIPTVPDELPALAAAAPVLRSRVAIAAPGPIALCHDRLLLMRYLARHRIPVPTTVTVRPSGVPRQLAGECPYVVTPRLANACGEVQVVHDRDQLPARNDTFLAQEFAPGDEYLAQVHRSAHHGVMTVILLRIGPLARLERLDPTAAPEITGLARTVVRTLDLTGVSSISVRRDADGRPMVIGVDPRTALRSELTPELLDGALTDAGLPLRSPQVTAAPS